MALSEEEKREIRSAYFKDYYDRKKDELAKKRKDKYDNDPEYREKIRISSIALRTRKKAELSRLRELGLLPKKVHKKRSPRTYFMEINGIMTQVYSIEEVSKKTNRSKVVLRDWIKRGIIPRSPLTTKKGYSLYTESMIDVINEVVASRTTVFSKDCLGDEVLRLWELESSK